MRIAYLTQSYPPMISGAAISAQQTAESMAKRGHQILVIAASDREYPYHTYKENITVLRLRSHKNPFRVGQRLMLYPHNRVLRLLKQFQPEVIHAHDPLQMGMLTLEYASRARIPVTLTTHQLPWFVASYLPKRLKPIIETILWTYARINLKRYTSIISPTQTIAKIIERKTGLNPNVISYEMDLQTFHPSPSLDPHLPLRQVQVSTGSERCLEPAARSWLNLPVNVPIILHVGRLDTDKSVDKVIRAAASAILKSEAHLLVVGDGCQKNPLVRLCRELGIEKRVHFTGFIPPAGLPEIYRMANIFVTASEIETQGIVLLEAAASGLPIVAVNATCISEIVHNNVNGFLVEPGDVTALDHAIASLLNHPNRACIMGRKGRMLVEGHGIQNTWALHESLYKDMSKQVGKRRMTKTLRHSNQWETMKSLLGLK